MYRLPVVQHCDVSPDSGLVGRAEAFAERLVRDEPTLGPGGPFRDLVLDHLEEGPTLHIDDLGEIPLLERFHSAVFLEDRARLRAGSGDFVATCAPPNPRFVDYTEHQLGLGDVRWLYPVPRSDPLRVATASWTDRSVRRLLLHALRTDRLRYVHPNMGTCAVWAVAKLLQSASRRPISVIAPPPVLTHKVNDKIWFTRVVKHLFGRHLVPRTMEVFNYTALAAAVCHLLHDGSRAIVVKVPDSAGGSGNLVLDPARVRGDSMAGVRRRLKKQLRELPWEPGARLLVGVWESDVLAAPSSQLWIPAEADGLPVVEGLYEQAIEGPTGEFRGSRPARLPQEFLEEFAACSWVLARLFQRLQYVGRCSFDAILVGTDLRSARLELIECNGRWGGTSTPMTLVNRLFGDWENKPYAARKCMVDGLREKSFDDVLTHFEPATLDVRTGRGSLVFYNPGRIRADSGIDAVAFADDWDRASNLVQYDVPNRLREMVAVGMPLRQRSSCNA